MTPPRCRTALPLAAGLLIFLAACDSAASGDAGPSPAPTPTAAPTAVASPASPTPAATPSLLPSPEEQALLAQYRGFWDNLAVAAAQPPQPRRELLSRYAVAPALERILLTQQQQDARGERMYGVNVPNVVDLQIKGDTASVLDCQDATGAGYKDIQTGELKTAGVNPNPVRVGLLQGSDRLWRVSTIDFVDEGCAAAGGA